MKKPGRVTNVVGYGLGAILLVAGLALVLFLIAVVMRAIGVPILPWLPILTGAWLAWCIADWHEWWRYR